MTQIIGIAGGIGSGKSTVTDHLRDKKFTVYDADEVAREAVMPKEPALTELADFFGVEIINGDGTLNRRKLAQIAFSDPEKSKKLNEILHKDIDHRIDLKLTEYMESAKAEDTPEAVFISAPLFFEAELDSKCDETWAVIADKKIRLKRTMDRDGLPLKEVQDRIDRQMSDEERAERADHVIRNNGTREELIEKVDKLLADI